MFLKSKSFSSKENKKSLKPRIFFVASTGGHLQEILGLAPIFNKYDSFLITEKTSSTQKLRMEYGLRCHYVIASSRAHFLQYLFRFSFVCIQSLYIFLRFRPDYVISTGAHTAVPFCLIAHFFRKKVIYIETRANFYEITWAGRIISRFADLFVIQRKSLEGLIPNAVLCEVDE